MDQIIRGIAMEGKVRAFAVDTTSVVEQLRQRHDTLPTATAALGRAVSAGALLAATLKDDNKLTIQIKGNGPLGQIVVDARASGEVRGYVDEPHVDLPLNSAGKLDVAGAVGREGYIYVIKDLGLKEPYRGSVPIISGELAEDFTYYLATSEQTPSAVALGVLVDKDRSVKASGGFMIQLLPGISDEEISQMEKQLARLNGISRLLEAGMPLPDILRQVLPSVKILEEREVRFRCQCSRERAEAMLRALGTEELKQMLEQEGKAEVTCHFCNETYAFSREQLAALIVS
jgi:molecular chaperone Hsp33